MLRTTIAALAALLLIAGCGGEDDTGAGGTGGSGGTGQNQDELCATYYPHPETQPQIEATTCVSNDWPRDSFCWRTTDEPSCYSGDGSDVAVGCYSFRDSSTGIPAGTQTVGCRLPGDCIAGGIDNPECCGSPVHEEGLGAWDCPTL